MMCSTRPCLWEPPWHVTSTVAENWDWSVLLLSVHGCVHTQQAEREASVRSRVSASKTSFEKKKISLSSFGSREGLLLEEAHPNMGSRVL